MSPRWNLVDFLVSRGARRNCPQCGHEHWDGWDQRVTLTRTLDDLGHTALELIPLICRNCGYVRLHSAHVLSDPREENTGA